MNVAIKHIVLPALAPAAMVGLYFTPVSLVGCANRGLMALGVVMASLLVAIAVAVRGVTARARGERSTVWPLIAVGILILPALLVVGPLG